MPPPDHPIRPPRASDDPIYLIDMALSDENQRDAVTETLKYNYQNEIDYDFFVENPVVEIQTDLLSAKMIAEELDVPRRMVSVKKRTAKSGMKTVRMYQNEYEETNLNRTAVSMTSQTFGNENEQLYETAVVEEIDEIPEEMIQSFCEEVGIDVKKEMMSRSMSFVSQLDESQLNHAINEQVKMDLTKEKLKKETVQNSVPVHEWRNKTMIPTKVKASVVDQIADKALNVLSNIPQMMTLMIQGNSKREEAEQKREEETEVLKRPKPPGKSGRRLTKIKNDLPDIEEEKSGEKKYSSKVNTKIERHYTYSSSSDEEVGQVGNMIGAIELYDSSKPIDKVDSKSIPIWRVAEGRDEKYLALDDYIEDLNRFSTLGYNVPEARLIYMSLNASNRMGMLKEFPSEKLQKLDDFIDFLKESYGRSELDLRAQLASMKRKAGESTHALLSRVICIYYRSKGMRPRTMSEITSTHMKNSKKVLTHPAEIADIIHYFVSALKNQALISQVKMRLHDLCLTELAAVTRDIENALDTSTINAVTTPSKSSDSPSSVDTEKLTKTIVNQISAVMNQKSKSKELCFICQKPGHRMADCWSRNKTDQNLTKPSQRGKNHRGRGYNERGRGYPGRGRGHNDRGRGYGNRGYGDRGRGSSYRGRDFYKRPEQHYVLENGYQRDTRSRNEDTDRNRGYEREERREYWCRRCGQQGHTERYCRVSLGRPYPRR